MKKNKKIKRFGITLMFIFITIFVFIGFTLLYNEVWKPFEDSTTYQDESKNSDELMNMPFYDLYVKNQYDQYGCTTYSRHGRHCILPQITMIFNYYTMDSYSIIINLDGDFDDVNCKCLSDFEFIATPIDYGEDMYFIEGIDVQDWFFKELKFDYDFYEQEGFMDIYQNNIRITSYWYGYNINTKQTSFSILNHEPSLDYYDLDSLRQYMITNLPI